MTGFNSAPFIPKRRPEPRRRIIDFEALA